MLEIADDDSEAPDMRRTNTYEDPSNSLSKETGKV